MENDDLDTMNDEPGDELEESGMHLVSDDEEDAEDEESAEDGKEENRVSGEAEEETESPPNGLAELDALEKSLDEERNDPYEEEDGDA